MAQLDRIRFGYVLKSRLEGLELSYTQITKLTGVSRRQISNAVNGMPIDAGASYMLAQLCEIDLFEMMPLEQQEQLVKIRKEQAKHAVTACVSHETMKERRFA